MIFFYLFHLKLYFVFDFNRVYNVNVKKNIYLQHYNYYRHTFFEPWSYEEHKK